MHPIQQDILHKLMTLDQPRYADLKADDLEGNHFMYHLRQLMQQDLVRKRTDGRYELTANGKLYVDDYSTATLAPRIQPKIVTLIVCTDQQGRQLLYRRKRQPFWGRIGFPYGKIHLGETTISAAQRELQEKTGLNGQLSHRGDAYIASYSQGQLISHILGHVFVATQLTGQLIPKSALGECFWGQVDPQQPQLYIPGVLDLMTALNHSPHQPFFHEWQYQVD